MLRFSLHRNSQWASRRLENWFQNSLKQLSALQQKQVGLLLGAACADAAAHSWQGYTKAEVGCWLQQSQKVPTLENSPCTSFLEHDYSSGTLDPSPYQYGLSNSYKVKDEGVQRRDMSEIPYSIHQLRSSFSCNSKEGYPIASSMESPSPSPLAFASVSKEIMSGSHRHATLNPRCVSLEEANGNVINLIDFSHSFSYKFFSLVVDLMGRSRGNFFNYVPQLQSAWVHEAQLAVSSSHSSDSVKTKAVLFLQEHKTLLHSLFAVIGLPVLYPYASDEWVHCSSECLLNFLLEIEKNKEYTSTEKGRHSILRRSCAWVVLSVLMRYLQSNPDPLRNSAILVGMRSLQAPFRPVEEIKNLYSSPSFSRSKVGPSSPFYGESTDFESCYPYLHGECEKVDELAITTESEMLAILQSLFPDSIQHTCFGSVQEHFKRETNQDRGIAGISSLIALGEEVAVVREALTIAAQFSTAASCAHPTDAFRRGIEAAIALGNANSSTLPHQAAHAFRQGSTESTSHFIPRWSVVTHRAALVGAFLGAKFGVRAIPLHWISATVDHAVVASMAVDVAQFSWNAEPLGTE